MNWLVLIGVLLAFAGLAGLGLSVFRALQIKRSGKTVEEAQAAFQRLIALNLGSLFVSVIGLACLVFALVL